MLSTPDMVRRLPAPSLPLARARKKRKQWSHQFFFAPSHSRLRSPPRSRSRTRPARTPAGRGGRPGWGRRGGRPRGREGPCQTRVFGRVEVKGRARSRSLLALSLFSFFAASAHPSHQHDACPVRRIAVNHRLPAPEGGSRAVRMERGRGREQERAPPAASARARMRPPGVGHAASAHPIPPTSEDGRATQALMRAHLCVTRRRRRSGALSPRRLSHAPFLELSFSQFRRRRRLAHPAPSPGGARPGSLHRGDGPADPEGRQPDAAGGRGEREERRKTLADPALSLSTRPCSHLPLSLPFLISDPRHHGHQRVRQVDAIEGPGRPPGLRGHGGARYEKRASFSQPAPFSFHPSLTALSLSSPRQSCTRARTS